MTWPRWLVLVFLVACNEERRPTLSNVSNQGTDQASGPTQGQDAPVPTTPAPAGTSSPPATPTCVRGHEWRAVNVLPFRDLAAGLFAGVSADETIVVWTSSFGEVRYAERTGKTEAFGAAGTVGVPAAVDVRSRLALAPNGLQLVGLVEGGRSFALLTRSGYGSPFSPGDPGAFQALNDEVSRWMGGDQITDIMFSTDTALVFRHASGTTARLRLSLRASAADAWQPSVAFPNEAAVVAMERVDYRLTGVSVDRHSLFYLDEGTGDSMVMFLDAPVQAFPIVPAVQSLDAQPTRDCRALYFVEGGSLYVAH